MKNEAGLRPMKCACRHMKKNGVRFASCERSERFMAATPPLHVCKANASFLFNNGWKPGDFAQKLLTSPWEYGIIVSIIQDLRGNDMEKLLPFLQEL